eukprot:RCo049943
MAVYTATDRNERPVVLVVPERYQLTHQVGSGTFGVVCSALDNVTGQEVAIKRVRPASTAEELRSLLRELRILKHLREVPNVISFFEAFQSSSLPGGPTATYLVLELLPTNLAEIIEDGQVSLDHAQYFAYQVLLGVEALHGAGIIHRDLKPRNLLVKGDCTLKICDFGMSRGHQEADETMTEYVITRWYRAPELLLKEKHYGFKVDIFSVGCILGEMFLGRPVLPGHDYLDQLRRTIALVGSPTDQEVAAVPDQSVKVLLLQLPRGVPESVAHVFPAGTPSEGIALLRRLLTFFPGPRFTAAEALRHPYFSDIFDESDLVTVPRFNTDVETTADEQELRRCLQLELQSESPPSITEAAEAASCAPMAVD